MWGVWAVIGIVGAVCVVSVFMLGFLVGRETRPTRMGKHSGPTAADRRRVILDQASGARKITRVDPASLSEGSSGGSTFAATPTRSTSLSWTAPLERPYVRSAAKRSPART